MTSRTASTIVAGLLLMGPSGSAHARVTGITFEPESPIVGHSVAAIATDDRKHEVARWSWWKIRGRVRCRGTDAGEDLLGMAQRRVRNRTWWDGRKDPDEPWRPEAPGDMLNHSHGVIESWAMLNIAPGDWAKIRPGSPI